MNPSARQYSKAAFYDVDGTLVKTNIVHTYGYYAMNRGSIRGIAGRKLGAIASIPLFATLDIVDRKIFNEFFYRYYAGLSEDRRCPGWQRAEWRRSRPASCLRCRGSIPESSRSIRRYGRYWFSPMFRPHHRRPLYCIGALRGSLARSSPPADTMQRYA